ncbi:STAS domain-containing protein [Streptomyces fructofermentans]|uniref:Anti-sigma factor antagonist n=1 Tax=Streptomyces fructofermentans TaxID=152141 RepID=A0A918NBX7_9ACTN|nr:STAS domain-containing protein [Streptomyces fructofermentans]GGX56527.1 hypothetical protein GCM10010515_24950 [Streptomyces fructofermentans]
MADTSQAEQPRGLSVGSEAADGVLVVTLTGEIDHHTGGLLAQALEVPDGTPARIVVDLGRVTFMDSTGVNILVSAHRTLTGSGGWLRLAAPTPPVLRTIQLVGIDTVIDCHPTLGQALAP